MPSDLGLNVGSDRVYVYDTTLRDGAQQAAITFSAKDKIRILERFDEFGMDYVEGGWPGSNPKDLEFFRQAKRLQLRNARHVAFGSTRRPGAQVAEDKNIKCLLEAGTPVVTVFGKTWDLHVREALGCSLEENLAMIGDTISYLKERVGEVLFDAEHFFDGYKANPDYAIKTLQVASEAGAHWLVLCDTNGGALTHELSEILISVREALPAARLGIHTHDDAGLAVANALEAVRLGARQVQGTVNGYGERCGNANLCTVIPALKLKMGYRCLTEDGLTGLTSLSHFVSEMANKSHNPSYPYVGANAFAHKGGVHVSAILKNRQTYEHVEPEEVGNARRVIVSELAGRSNLEYLFQERSLGLKRDDPEVKELLDQIKEMENQGYHFEAAEASFELMALKAVGAFPGFFTFEGFRVGVEKRPGVTSSAEATVKVRVGERLLHTAAEGDGPVNALDIALRKALEGVYPALRKIKLVDYKVRVLDGKDGTATKVRVLIESRDETGSWSTIGVSENIIEASWQALADSLEYGLWRRYQLESQQKSS